MNTRATLFKVTAALWIVWGLVHVMAGIIIVTNPAEIAVANVADAIDATELATFYHPAVNALLNQHGFNLAWVGLVTFISAFFIWKQNAHATFLAAIVGGLTDVGYFIYMDLGGFVNFVPGTIMTIISALAIINTIVIHKLPEIQDKF